MKGFITILLLAVAVSAKNQCPLEQEINWDIELLLPHEDCDKFYKCAFGEPVEQRCPPGLNFNLENYQCDWVTSVDCEDRNIPVPEEKPEEKPEKPDVVPEVEKPEVPKPEEKPEKPDVVPEVEKPEVPKPEEKPEKPDVVPEVEKPEVPKPEEKPEKPDVVPEVEKPEVPKPEEKPEKPDVVPEVENPEVPKPDEKPEVPEVVEPEEEIPEIEFLENGCPANPHVHWLLPSKSNCNQYFYCVWGEKVIRECSSSLHFNPVLQVCDWPWAAGCSSALNKHLLAIRNRLIGGSNF